LTPANVEILAKARLSNTLSLVTQQFNTTTSMGGSRSNVLLSFAQLEREVTSERIRDNIAAPKRKGLWVGGPLPLGYAMKSSEERSRIPGRLLSANTVACAKST
jgi:DNA invertase Pin-like site-specific DNA recombinase